MFNFDFQCGVIGFFESVREWLWLLLDPVHMSLCPSVSKLCGRCRKKPIQYHLDLHINVGVRWKTGREIDIIRHAPIVVDQSEKDSPLQVQGMIMAHFCNGGQRDVCRPMMMSHDWIIGLAVCPCRNINDCRFLPTH